ncbi:MAG: hypothetical protein ABL866_04315 [Devosia sp.]
MKIILFWLLASGSYLAAMALPATGAEAFQCDVLEFHDESPTRAQDDALIKRSMKRTFVILVGEREITAVSKSAYDEASSRTYTRLPERCRPSAAGTGSSASRLPHGTSSLRAVTRHRWMLSVVGSRLLP